MLHWRQREKKQTLDELVNNNADREGRNSRADQCWAFKQTGSLSRELVMWNVGELGAGGKITDRDLSICVHDLGRLFITCFWLGFFHFKLKSEK